MLRSVLVKASPSSNKRQRMMIQVTSMALMVRVCSLGVYVLIADSGLLIADCCCSRTFALKVVVSCELIHFPSTAFHRLVFRCTRWLGDYFCRNFSSFHCLNGYFSLEIETLDCWTVLVFRWLSMVFLSS